MKGRIKNFKGFSESIQINLIRLDLNESMGMFYENILKSVGAEELDPYETFKLPEDEYSEKMDLDTLSEDSRFINSLLSIGLRKSNVEYSEDYETFFNKPCKFMFIYRTEALDIENPDYIMFQSWNESLSKWEDTKLYKINGDVKNFYDKLSSKIVEIEDDGNIYIYQSSNRNEWLLQNSDKESEKFMKYFRKEDFEDFINSNKLQIRIK